MNGVEYGRSSFLSSRDIIIRSDEEIEHIQYHKAAWWWKGAFCSITLKTNLTSYEIGYCGDTEFSVHVPLDQDLNSFISANIIYGDLNNKGANWIIGFQNETEIESDG